MAFGREARSGLWVREEGLKTVQAHSWVLPQQQAALAACRQTHPPQKGNPPIAAER